ncbi:NAD(P)H-binding protein [Nitratireductor aquimarinus]|uniref:NAD(P)H-binding protein n=1 Tax=Alphaproteobacteria TaxID=28211 RepID=UPI0019D32DD0|nr:MULTISPECIES: NAD(P)H-binding protein [Alphaproteobacteria]MBN7757682.1 NAD(P)H-binding protein [Nitratireductor aquimarinus]MBY6000443.1 NAD(P)H-binding protein [Tritonibacter mobilis]MBY6022473.1 NAD(P)H-binding protein [Nitratireductor sp. DP7N14-4]
MIVVTAPTSHIGSKVVNNLLDVSISLRLVVRGVTKPSAAIRDRTEVVEGSHGDASVVGHAFEGADAVFWLAPPDPAKTLEEAFIEFTRPAAEAIRHHGVLRVVSITALGRGTHWQDRAGPVTASIRMDDMLMASGAAFRGLAMPSFMENTARQAVSIGKEGLFFGPIGPDRKLPLTATRDMAAVAARLLGNALWHGQEEVPVLGPKDLSFDDQAAIVSDVIGREVRYQQISFDRFKQQFLDRGASESFAQGYVDMYRAKDEGIDNATLRTSENTVPTSFRMFCEQVLKPAVASS